MSNFLDLIAITIGYSVIIGGVCTYLLTRIFR